jgi:hypothetical protein
MGGHVDSCQALLLQKVNFVGQSYHLREFKWSWLFTPSSLELGESTSKRREARFMVFVVEPCPMLSPQGSIKGRSRKPARGWV